MLTIRPYPAPTMCGSTRAVRWKTLLRFVWSTASHSSGDILASERSRVIPALLTSTTPGPSRASRSSRNARDARDARQTRNACKGRLMTSTPPPTCRTSRACGRRTIERSRWSRPSLAQPTHPSVSPRRSWSGARTRRACTATSGPSRPPTGRRSFSSFRSSTGHTSLTCARGEFRRVPAEPGLRRVPHRLGHTGRRGSEPGRHDTRDPLPAARRESDPEGDRNGPDDGPRLLHRRRRWRPASRPSIRRSPAISCC